MVNLRYKALIDDPPKSPVYGGVGRQSCVGLIRPHFPGCKKKSGLESEGNRHSRGNKPGHVYVQTPGTHTECKVKSHNISQSLHVERKTGEERDLLDSDAPTKIQFIQIFPILIDTAVIKSN